jgi:Flp pilus assembly protein TadG
MSAADLTGPARDDRGTATVFVVGLALILLALAGLVVDGGLAINARERVADDVEQASRAGAERVDVLTLRQSGVVRLDPAAARLAAEQFLASRGYAVGDVTVTTDAAVVHTRARRQVSTALLSLVFINSFTVTAQARARPASGITAAVP